MVSANDAEVIRNRDYGKIQKKLVEEAGLDEKT